MPAIQDKCIVIPLENSDIRNTVQSLPRLPSESGIIDVQWKRRACQKNAHLEAKVDPVKIFDALQFLKDCGNEHYSDTQSRIEYMPRCKQDDPDGYGLIFGDDQASVGLRVHFFPDGSAEPILELNKYQEQKTEEKSELDYIEKDTIRKFQIDYDASTCMVERFPEAMEIEAVTVSLEEDSINEEGQDEPNQLHIVCPGEGKTPVNLTFCKDWDAKAFPMLHPDGKNHLFDKERARKLFDLDYCKQRLFNVDPRWRDNIQWVFAMCVYREKKDFQRNIDLSYRKGKKQLGADGKSSYSLKDPYSVFQNVVNTPAYHKKGKFEMFARLSNQGPFHVFFTVSCADSKWMENVTSSLIDLGLDVRCSVDNNQRESYEVFTNGRWVTLDHYVKREMDKSLHEHLRRNVVTATRIYQARVQALMREIICKPSNPLSVKHFSTKLEFQHRGAGHHHGVLWLDIEKIQEKVDIQQLNVPTFNPYLDHHLKDPSSLTLYLDEFLRERSFDPKLAGSTEKHETLNLLEQLLSTKELCKKDEDMLTDLKVLYPLYGLKASLKRLHKGKDLEDEDFEVIVKFVDSFSTVSTHPALVGSVVADIALDVNQHCHTKTCRKYKSVCRFNFPKLPSCKTIIARPLSKHFSESEKKSIHAKYTAIISKVKEVLTNKDLMDGVLEGKNMERTSEEAVTGRARRIDKVLEMAGFVTPEEKQIYTDALTYSSSGFTVVQARDVDEIWVNSYNREITMAWGGNSDFQFCLDFYSIVSYITEYYAKDDTGVVKTLVDTLKASDCQDFQEQMKLLMNTWIKNRSMGSAEATYRLAKEFHFRDSDTKCVFLQTAPQSERSKFLKNVTDKPGYKNSNKVTVTNQKGDKNWEYVEQYEIHSKYERRNIEENEDLKELCLAQMVKMYESSWGRSQKEDSDSDQDSNDDEDEDNNIKEEENNMEEAVTTGTITSNVKPDKFMHVMSYRWQEGQGPLLPKMFRLKDPFPGEPPFMRLRKKPLVLRFHQYKVEKDPEGYWFSEAMLYTPFEDEDELTETISKAKIESGLAWETFFAKITHVKNQAMEFLEDHEEARMMAAELFIDSHLTGELIDPEGEQENTEDLQEVISQDVQFAHLDPDYMMNPEQSADVFEKSFRPIEVRPFQQLREEARQKDFYQKKVLEIAIRYARGIVKARKGKNPRPSAPLLIVDGPAGTGKSCTINIVKQMAQMILQQPGDNPECPFILLCAPTGTAAVNIKGQTLHSTFGFTFDNDHNSLSDKIRDKKRAVFRNLSIVIIDEISMVKADQLYQLDLRLREIMMRPNDIFGSVSIFVFGDILQLKPVKGRPVWSEPRSADFLHAFLVQSYWEQFEVISLEENHRQSGDAEYADILNRVRVGSQTESDINILQTRVRPEGHPDLVGAMVIGCTHKVVNKYNQIALDKLKTPLLTMEAINSHANIPNYQPKIDPKKGVIGTTSYLQTLCVKVGCRLMMIDNIDVVDGLSNGSMGTLEGVFIDKKSGIVLFLMVRFDSPDSGRELQRCHPQIVKQFLGCTPIKREIYKYSTSSSARGAKSKVATLRQFPVILAFSSTCHKIQGQTILSPKTVAVDLRSVFGPNQAYVMMGRVQQLNQLFFIGELPEGKITTDKGALQQLESLKQRSINRNPSVWEKSFGVSVKVYFQNIHSLKDKILDILGDHMIFFGDILVFAESWLFPEEQEDIPLLQINNFKLHLNSIGRGKGLAVYYKSAKFSITDYINDHSLQLSKLESKNLTVVCFYRSQDCKSLKTQLQDILPVQGDCLVIGDFNLCTREQPNHSVFKMLSDNGFKLQINQATHIDGGHLDQAWIRSGRDQEVTLYSQYFCATDHDALLVTMYESSTEQGKQNIKFYFIQFCVLRKTTQHRCSPKKESSKKTKR